MSLGLALLLAAAAAPVCPEATAQADSRNPESRSEQRPICSLRWMFGIWSVHNEDPTGGLFGDPVESGLESIAPRPGAEWIEFRSADDGQERDFMLLGFDYRAMNWISLTIDESTEVARAVAPNGSWAQGDAVFEGQIVFGAELVDGRLTFRRIGPDEFVLTGERQAEGQWERAWIRRYRRHSGG